MSEEKKAGGERLQKVLARAGVASRRNAEKLIVEGSVSVNGTVVTELGTKVDPLKDKIKVSGKLILAEVDKLYVAFNKPKGVISALSDPEGRPSIGDLIRGIPTRVTPIGRMDFNSEGLILLTNDGELAERILKSRELVKTFLIKVKGHPTNADIEGLRDGIFTRDGVLRFSDISVDEELRSKSWLKLEVTEGSKLDIRELFNRRGLMVDRIIRQAIGSMSISGIEPGEWKIMSRKDFEAMFEKKLGVATTKGAVPPRGRRPGPASDSRGSGRPPRKELGGRQPRSEFGGRGPSRDAGERRPYGDRPPRRDSAERGPRRESSSGPRREGSGGPRRESSSGPRREGGGPRRGGPSGGGQGRGGFSRRGRD